MELKEFIKTAITDITEAVSELQSDLTNGTIVNPSFTKSEVGKSVLVDNEVRLIERLNFDVAVTASETSGFDGKAKAGINIFGAKLGAETSSKSENVSRLTFSIPILLPCTHVKTPAEQRKEDMAKRHPAGQTGQDTASR